MSEPRLGRWDVVCAAPAAQCRTRRVARVVRVKTRSDGRVDGWRWVVRWGSRHECAGAEKVKDAWLRGRFIKRFAKTEIIWRRAAWASTAKVSWSELWAGSGGSAWLELGSGQ